MVLKRKGECLDEKLHLFDTKQSKRSTSGPSRFIIGLVMLVGVLFLVTSPALTKGDDDQDTKLSSQGANLGVGWRFTPNFLAQYIFSTDFGHTSPRHILLLRYTFNIGER